MGAANKRTREIAEAAMAEGITPLEYMLAVLRDESIAPSAVTTWQKLQHPTSTRGWLPLRPMSPSLATRRRLKSLSNCGAGRGSV